jgi:polar amino acid transport system permease protein
MSDISTWDIFRNLLMAARWTIALTLTAFVGGGIVGMLVLFARTSGNKALVLLSQGFIELFQGTPLLMQMFLMFFGVALFGLDVPAWLAAGVALTLWSAAFLAEIWRGCVQAIPKGQWEASSSLALNYIEQMRHVILPQAIRIAIPPTVGFSVQIVKGTAVASIIGFVELTKVGTMLTNATFKPFLVYSGVALMFFLLCWPLSLWARYLEGKIHGSRAH